MNKIGKDHPDIKIAKDILTYYETNLEIIDNLEDFTDDFIDNYKKSLFGAKILPKTLTIFHFYKKIRIIYIFQAIILQCLSHIIKIHIQKIVRNFQNLLVFQRILQFSMMILIDGLRSKRFCQE